MKKILVCAVLAFVVSACSGGQVGNDFAFQPTSEKALIVMGLDVRGGYGKPSLLFRMYDPETGQALKEQKFLSPSDRELSSGQILTSYFTGQSSRPRGKTYIVAELEPGNWFIGRINGNYSTGYISYKSVSILSRGTVTFDAEPGHVIYLGEYRLGGALGSSFSLIKVNEDFDAAEAELDKFTNISAKLERGEVVRRKFTCEHTEKLFGGEGDDCKRDKMVIDVESDTVTSEATSG